MSNFDFENNNLFKREEPDFKLEIDKKIGYRTSIILGSFSLFLVALSLYLEILIHTFLTINIHRLAFVTLLYIIFITTLSSLIISIIGYLKAKIFSKTGYYATTSYILNGSGIILSSILIILNTLTFIFI